MGQEADQLQELGAAEIRNALKGIPIPEDWRPNLTMGYIITDRATRTVELYVARERPEDAIVLATVVIDRATRVTKTTVHHEAFENT